MALQRRLFKLFITKDAKDEENVEKIFQHMSLDQKSYLQSALLKPLYLRYANDYYDICKCSLCKCWFIGKYNDVCYECDISDYDPKVYCDACIDDGVEINIHCEICKEQYMTLCKICESKPHAIRLCQTCTNAL